MIQITFEEAKEIVKRAEEHQKQREKEFAIAELEKIKKKLILKLSEGFDFGITEALNIIDEELSELKGEKDD